MEERRAEVSIRFLFFRIWGLSPSAYRVSVSPPIKGEEDPSLPPPLTCRPVISPFKEVPLSRSHSSGALPTFAGGGFGGGRMKYVSAARWSSNTRKNGGVSSLAAAVCYLGEVILPLPGVERERDPFRLLGGG